MYVVDKKVVERLFEVWNNDARSRGTSGNSSRDWYNYCEKLGLKRGDEWTVETESQVTMILLKAKF